jgi:hypothetical protein
MIMRVNIKYLKFRNTFIIRLTLLPNLRFTYKNTETVLDISKEGSRI